ncbi:hypothetical protein Cni_G21960 [Canna indica]|uniref:DUF4283 domain-containing protein n=1 Tax=Canna indica TaxID=4628 RepID=A0AAQ3QHU5_9LILI|nr:hypothetical protein Cni_G21960 [Canna indica]
MDIEEGFFVFHFRSQEQATNILSGGPWSFQGDVIRLVPWKPFFRPWMESFSYAPMWIRIHALPLELWNPVSDKDVFLTLPSTSSASKRPRADLAPKKKNSNEDMDCSNNLAIVIHGST